MSDLIKSILCRVLSQEIANQKKWKKQDIERFGKCDLNRDGIIAEIKDFMEENGIEFSYDWYFSV